MNKIITLLIHCVFFSFITLPGHTVDANEQKSENRIHPIHFFGFGNFDDALRPDDFILQPLSPILPKISNHAFVPDSLGRTQGAEAFKLLFTGEEDRNTVRIKTQVPQHQYTYREQVKFYLTGQKAPVSYLSGTMTPYGVLTNGHGFMEEVPSVSNKILEFVGSEKRLYRVLEPIEIEQGLTLKSFKAEDDQIYYNPRHSIPLTLYSLHNAYTRQHVDSVFIHYSYIQEKEKLSIWQYGRLDSDNDLALVTLKSPPQFSATCQVAEYLPSDNMPLSVRIYQYPSGHPLQKVSEELANFSTRTHQCVTLPGSSGSSLRDTQNDKIVGVHASGIVNKHNSFIPVSEHIINEINEKIM